MGISETPLTVGDLIQRLQAFDPSLRMMIEDADTDWFIDILKVRQIDDEYGELGQVVVVKGDYVP